MNVWVEVALYVVGWYLLMGTILGFLATRVFGIHVRVAQWVLAWPLHLSKLED